jgi:DNA-binding NarL/FixJ family response regulator
VQLPAQEAIDAAVVDYRLGDGITALQVIERVKRSFPAAPVIVLSDMFWMPHDVAPFAAAFVRKGEPEVLLSTLAALIAGENAPPSAS